MIQNIENYLKSLFSANVSVSGLEDALKLIKASSELKAVLNDPNVPAADKAKVAAHSYPMNAHRSSCGSALLRDGYH